MGPYPQGEGLKVVYPPDDPRSEEYAMAKLSAKKRDSLPKDDFALSGRRFPVNDKNHARAALSGATRAVNAGNISEAQAAKVRAKARKKLGD